MTARLTHLRALATSVALAVAVLGSPAGTASGDVPLRPSAAGVHEVGGAHQVGRAHHVDGAHDVTGAHDVSAAHELVGAHGPDAAQKRRTRAPRRTPVRAVALAAPAKPSTAFAFSTLLDGKPVRWDPCAPIRWTANTAQGPAGGLAVLQESVARIAQLTGTTWQYVGPSTSTPTTAYLPKQSQADFPPVLLGWTDGAGSDLLAGQPRSVLGMTRTAWFGVQRPDGSKVAAIRSAVVALDRTDTLPLRGATSWKALVLHELGHVMGLAHVEDRSQLMATVLPASPDVQAGDVAGLARVGRGAGCVVVA